jgi:cyanuric acid amidohydrolase
MEQGSWVYELWRFAVSDPGDVSGLAAMLRARPECEVVAVMGKTEGNGCVNDFSRMLASRAYGDVLRTGAPKGTGTLPAVLIMSGGTEGVLTPHVTVFVRRPVAPTDRPGPALVCGAARTVDIGVRELGRMAQVHAVAQATREAMTRAWIDDPADVHFVQIKCPLLTDGKIQQARAAGLSPVTDDTYLSMAYSRAASALGVAVALGEVEAGAVTDADICHAWNLYSAVASTSAGAEVPACEVLVLGNGRTAAGPLQIAHAVMRDPIDAGAILRALAGCGIEAGAYDSGLDRVVQVFAKADPVGVVRGRRTTMLNDSDIHATRHARAAVGGLIAGLVGDPMIYVSGGAEHQGPLGGGPVAVVALRVEPAQGRDAES